MNTASRLSAYGAVLVVLFGAAYVAGDAVIPDGTVASWAGSGAVPHETHGAADLDVNTTAEKASMNGLSLAASGFRLGALRAPTQAGTSGQLAFEIFGPAGAPVTEYETAHGQQLHLIVVRSDGAEYRHVYPTLDASTGTWSMPWVWDSAGTYRVYTDFTSADGTTATLSRTVDVAGATTSSPPTEVRTRDSVDGFDVTVSGDLVGGQGSELTLEVTRDGAPVTELQPYLGAFGHLVALREGDLAYLHVHAHGEAPKPEETAGPGITFTAEAPTEGRYLLYLDFQVAGQVRTATFVLDTAPPKQGKEAATGTESETADDGHDGH